MTLQDSIRTAFLDNDCEESKVRRALLDCLRETATSAVRTYGIEVLGGY